MTIEDLSELILLINWEGPAPRLKELLLKLPSDAPKNPNHSKTPNLQYLLPYLYQLRRELKEKEFDKYIEEKGEEIVERMLELGPENMIYTDAPEYVTHRQITKRLYSRFIQRMKKELGSPKVADFRTPSGGRGE